MTPNQWVNEVSPSLKSDTAHVLRVMCAHCRLKDGLVMDLENPDRILDLAFYEGVCGLSNSTVKRAFRELKQEEVIRDTGRRRGKTGKIVVYMVTGADYGWDPQAFLEARQRGPSPKGPIEIQPVPDSPSPSAWEVLAVCLDQGEGAVANEAPDGAGPELDCGPGPAEGQLTATWAGERLHALAQRYAEVTMSGCPSLADYTLAMEDLMALGVEREAVISVTLEAAELLLQASGREWLRNNGAFQRQLFLEKVIRYCSRAETISDFDSQYPEQAASVLRDICEGLDCDKTALDRPFHHQTLAVLGLLAVGFDVDTAVQAVQDRLRASLQVVVARWEEAHPQDEGPFHRRSARSRLEWALYGPDGDQSGQAGPV